MTSAQAADERTVSVSLPGGRGYPVVIGRDLFARAAESAPATVTIVSNPTVLKHYQQQLTDALTRAGKIYETITISDGEEHKNMATVTGILDQLVTAQTKRDGGIIALGGGVVGDIAGFAAAIYMRGIALIQMPTTLLAQVDAAIGGKTGVNHPAGKNLIGSFYQPQSVWCDIDTLATLSTRDFNSGLAEVVKYGLLGTPNAPDFFAWLETNQEKIMVRDATTLTEMIAHSVQCKADIVAADEHETTNRRALLNLGHTFAHAVETATHYQRWTHGEAVAYGLVAAATLSEQLCNLPAAVTTRIKNLLSAFNLPTALPADLTIDSITTAMRLDKKHTHQQQHFILLNAIGRAHHTAVTGTAIIHQTLTHTAA